MTAMLFGAAFDVQLNHPLNQLNRFASVLKQFFKKREKIREIREVIKIFESLSDQSDSAALEVGSATAFTFMDGELFHLFQRKLRASRGGHSAVNTPVVLLMPPKTGPGSCSRARPFFARIDAQTG
ncbi:hypothetical protein [uncultured Roseibium sp.]|uniref:hypothetical protein n=1 Tax=uncultured Roseibium sp. TaxID=1936171 RepID=UPI0032174F7A